MEMTFLMCSERSGGNLLTKIMNAHSQYCGPSPIHLIRILLDHRNRYGNLQNDDNWQALCRDARDLFLNKTGIWLTDWPAQIDGARTLANLILQVYKNEALKAGKSKVFIKENHLYRYLPFILANFAPTKIIYLVRDPRDMALSWKNSAVLRGGVMRAAKIWKTDQVESLKVFQWLNESNHIYLLKYEDLLAQPEDELQKMCSFLNIPFETDMLRFQDDRLTRQNADRTELWQNLQKPLLKANFNKYKQQLSFDEIAYVENLCKDEMEKLGYMPYLNVSEDLRLLEEKIRPFEKWEKEAYQALPESEKHLRRSWVEVVNRIKNRPVQPVLTKSFTNSEQVLA